AAAHHVRAAALVHDGRLRDTAQGVPAADDGSPSRRWRMTPTAARIAAVKAESGRDTATGTPGSWPGGPGSSGIVPNRGTSCDQMDRARSTGGNISVTVWQHGHVK